MMPKNCWLIACQSSELKNKPLGVEILGKPIVIFRTRDEDKSITALEDRCPHRGVNLSQGRLIGNHIQCLYHGWQFGSDGECKKIPGRINSRGSDQSNPIKAKIYSYPVLEKDGFIWIGFNPKSDTPQPSLPHPISQKMDSFVWKTQAVGNLPNVLENFLDGFHTHYVHSGLVRSDTQRQRVIAEIFAQPDQVECKYRGETRQNGWISRLFEPSRQLTISRFLVPSTAQLDYIGKRGVNFRVTVFLTPVRPSLQMIHTRIETRKGILPNWLKCALLTPFLRKVTHQDLRILKLQNENNQRFGKEDFRSTELDIMRPYIVSLLEGKAPPPNRSINFMV